MNTNLKKGIVIGGTILALGGGVLYGDLNKNEISKEKLTAKYELATEIKAKYKIDGTSLKKETIKNAELDKYKHEPKDKIEVILGDVNSADFTPDIEMKRWDEVSFKIKPRLNGVATKDKTLSFEGDKVKFKTPKMDFEMYDVAPTETDEGSYKFIWFLNEKPATNKIEFDIETAGLDFFYQPELTAEEIAQGASRPENVVGSYAVYHQTKGGMNDSAGKEYKTGKAFHIYRPHIIDAEGKETWGNLHIENGIYSVEIPQDFLDKAVYPIKSNDEFGNKTTQETRLVQTVDKLWGGVFSAASAGTVDDIRFYGDRNGTVSTNAKGVVVLASTKTIVSNGVSPVLSVNSGTAQWWTRTYTSKPTITATSYWLMWVNAGTDIALYYDYSAGQAYVLDSSNSYTTPTDPTDVSSTSDSVFSIYVTYTASGGGAPVPNNDVIIFE